jgi:magnesium transporter
MNFDPQKAPWIMPMIRWRFGFPLVVLGMLVLAGAMLVYFVRKGWIGERSQPPEEKPESR